MIFTKRALCVFGIVLLTPLLFFLNLIRTTAAFEHFLDSLFITFDDFPQDYTQALIKSTARNNTPPLKYDYSSFPPHDPALNIPHIIHFIWFKDLYEVRPNASDIAHVGSDTPALCRKYNPNFKINIWNASSARELLEEHYAWFMPTYDGYKYPIQRVDAFKYFLLWHYGGVFMDMDVSCRRSLIPLLQFPAWFPRASPLGVNNDLMASRPRHPVLWKMIKSLERRDKGLLFPWFTIFWTTGPRFATDMLNEWFNEHSGDTYLKDTSKALSDPDNFYTLPPPFYSEKYTFFGHRPGGTWYGGDVMAVLWLLARPWIIVLIGFSLVACCLLVLFRKRAISATVTMKGHIRCWRQRRDWSRVPLIDMLLSIIRPRNRWSRVSSEEEESAYMLDDQA